MPSSNRPHSVFTFLKPRPKKVVLFPEIGRANFFFLSLTARIVEIVSEHIFFVSEKKERKNTDTQTNKKEKKLKKISGL